MGESGGLPEHREGLSAGLPESPCHHTAGHCDGFSLEGFDEAEHSVETQSSQLWSFRCWFQSRIGPGVLVQPVGLLPPQMPHRETWVWAFKGGCAGFLS